MKNSFKLFLCLLLFLLVQLSYAEGSDSNSEATSSSDFFTDLLAEIEYVQGQVLQLADAFPEDKYSWRPSDGVRSVGEAFVHLGTGNYFLLSFLGGSKPEGFDEMDKKLTKKAEIIDFIKKSYDDAKKFIATLKMEDLEKPVDFFNNKSNGRRMLFLTLYHSHEHLGQEIAYARMNGIVPPWSMPSK